MNAPAAKKPPQIVAVRLEERLTVETRKALKTLISETTDKSRLSVFDDATAHCTIVSTSSMTRQELINVLRDIGHDVMTETLSDVPEDEITILEITSGHQELLEGLGAILKNKMGQEPQIITDPKEKKAAALVVELDNANPDEVQVLLNVARDNGAKVVIDNRPDSTKTIREYAVSRRSGDRRAELDLIATSRTPTLFPD